MSVAVALDPHLVLGVCLALAAAAVFGLGSAAQQRVVARVSPDARLVREPVWVAGVLAVGVGLALQIAALAFGPVALVQPLGVTSVLFAAFAARRRLDRTSAVGVVACVFGLSGFLRLAEPTEATGDAAAFGVVPVALAVVLALGVVGALVVARRSAGEARAVALAVAAGGCYGVSAGMLKVVAGQLRFGGAGEPFLHPALYVAALIGPLGFVLSQHAFGHARSAAPVLAVLTTVDPLVAVAVGIGWLGEGIVTTPPALVGETIAAMAVVCGVVAVGRGGDRQPVAR